MRRSTRWAWGLLALTVLLAGCLKFKQIEDEKTVGVGAKDVTGVLTTPPQKKDMDVTVTATTSPAAPVTLYLVQADDEAAQQNAMQALDGGHDPANLIAKSAAGETPSVQGSVAAGKECVVIVANSSGKATSVTAKIIGKY